MLATPFVSLGRLALPHVAHNRLSRSRFNELAMLIDPGKEPKMDKPSILADAIKFVKQVSAENHQLKMLNKFLEVGGRTFGWNVHFMLGHAQNAPVPGPQGCTNEHVAHASWGGGCSHA